MNKTKYYIKHNGKIDVAYNIETISKIKEIDSNVIVYARVTPRKKVIYCDKCDPNIMIITESFGEKKVYFANSYEDAIKKIPKYERVLDVYDIWKSYKVVTCKII